MLHKKQKREKIKEGGREAKDEKDYAIKTKGGNQKTSLSKKIEKCIKKLCSHQRAQKFMNSDFTDTPCLSSIEKQFKSGKYKTFYEFQMDIRNMWNYYYKINTNNETYQQITEMAQFSEEVFKDVDSPQEEKGKLNEMHKELNKIGGEIQQFKGTKGMDKFSRKEEKTSGTNEEKMSFTQKSELGNKIRNLNKDQLRGIVKLLSSSNSMEGNPKYFEFDIDKLSEQKLRQLDKYVESCIHQNNTQNAQKAAMENNASKSEIEKLKKNLNTANPATTTKTMNQPTATNMNNNPQNNTVNQSANSANPTNRANAQSAPQANSNPIEDSISSSESESDSLSD